VKYGTRKGFSALVLAGVAGVTVLTGGQLPHKSVTTTVPTQTPFEQYGTTLDGWGWASAPFSGDDAPYLAIVKTIEKGLKHGKSVHSFVATYQDQEEFHSQDPLAVFAWGAAKCRSCSWVPSPVASDHDLSALPDEMAAVLPQPHTYDWVRLRFLVQAEENAQPELQAVGERLLIRQPHDREVQWQLARVLRLSTNPAQVNESVQIAQALVAEDPKELLYRQMLANCLEDRFWNCGDKRADADAAIATYQYYVDHAPAGDPVSPNLIKGIETLNKAKVIDWTPAQNLSLVQPIPPPQLYKKIRPRPHKPGLPLPTGPGEPMPSLPQPVTP